MDLDELIGSADVMEQTNVTESVIQGLHRVYEVYMDCIHCEAILYIIVLTDMGIEVRFPILWAHCGYISSCHWRYVYSHMIQSHDCHMV